MNGYGQIQGGVLNENISEAIGAAMNSVYHQEEEMEYDSLKRKIDEDSRISNKLRHAEIINPSTPATNPNGGNIVSLIAPVTPTSEPNNSPSSLSDPKNNDQDSHSKQNTLSYEKLVNNRYSSIDQGPYALYVDTMENVKVHAMAIGKMLRDRVFELYKEVSLIKRISGNRFKIIVKAYKTANSIIESDIWKINKLICYIPDFMLFRQGVVRDIDVSLTEEEILSNIDSDIPILKVRRIFKKDRRDINKNIPTPVVILSFRGQYIPYEIKLLGVLCKVDMFRKRVIQCFCCLRYGHTSNTCRSSFRCEICGNSHEKRECQGPMKCIFCLGPHKSTDKTACPEYKKQLDIKQIMAEKNISFTEAKISLKEEVEKYADKLKTPPPSHTSNEIFPPLNSPSNIIEIAPAQNPGGIRDKQNLVKVHNTNYQRSQSSRSHFSNPINVSNTISPPDRPIFESPHYKIDSLEKLKEVIISIVKRVVNPDFSLMNNEISSIDINLLIKNIIKELMDK